MSTAKARLLDTIRTVGGESLRDLHLFDDRAHEVLYLRDDVADILENVDLPKYIDNERYGFVTRETYEDLHYAEYKYTVRGFEDFEQFRTFLGPSHDVGVLASFDQPSDLDYAIIAKNIGEIVAEEGVEAFVPNVTE